MDDFGKFNINHINVTLFVFLQINAICLYVPANERIIQTNANIYSLLRFFKFPYNCDNYMHFTGYVLQHGDLPHFFWGKNVQCTYLPFSIRILRKRK